MKLRGKAVLIFGSTLVLLAGLVLLLSSRMLLTSFRQFEDGVVRRETLRGEDALRHEAAFLNVLSSDWAAWDDTYEYFSDGNRRYFDSNLVDSTFTSLRLNFLVFIRPSGEVLYARGFDLNGEEDIPVPGALLEMLRPGGVLVSHDSPSSSVAGLVLLPEGPVMVSSRPVVTSDNTGPINGSLIMARFITEAEVGRIGDNAGLSLHAAALAGGEALPPREAEAWKALEGDEDVHIAPEDGISISGYTIVEDVFGGPALLLRASMPRDVYQQGMLSVRYYVLAVVGVGTFVIALLWVVLEMTILSRVRWLGSRLAGIRDAASGGRKIAMEGADEITDIADTVNAVLGALERAGEEFNRAVLSSLSERIAVMDREGNVIASNIPWEKSGADTDRGCFPCTKVGKNFFEAWDGREMHGGFTVVLDEIRDVVRGKRPYCEHEFALPGDPAERCFLLHCTAFSGREGGAVLSMIDITDRKRVETALETSLREKEILLREVHHRVKNNLQIIASLLKMQEGRSSNPEVIEALQVHRNRVYSMALVHEKLYAQSRFTSLNVKEYIDALARSIIRSLGAENITYISDVAPIALNIQVMIPCGLIINEIVTNAVKHAFAPDEQGEIRISLFAEGDGTAALTIEDNGRGLPEAADADKAATLGLMLVRSLVSQINGSLRIEKAGGAKFGISFPIAREDAQP